MNERDMQWEPADHQFPTEAFNDFLSWSIKQDADDIRIKSRRPIKMHIHGRKVIATRSRIDHGRILSIVSTIQRGADSRALGGEPQDMSYVIFVDGDRKETARYRVNLTAVECDNQQGLELSLRRIPTDVPTFDDIDVHEVEIREAWRTAKGVTITNGIPGSGKSTLNAAGFREMLQRGEHEIQAYEKPIEFIFDQYETGAATYSASEVGRDVESFSAGIRSSLRRLPEVINIGEARDRETIHELINAGDMGMAVYSTTHSTKCAVVPRRLLTVYETLQERRERGAMLLDMLNLLITQRLVEPAAKTGRRVALREFVFFHDDFKRELLRADMEQWTALIEAEVERQSGSIETQAKRAFEEGRISQRAFEIHGGRHVMA